MKENIKALSESGVMKETRGGSIGSVIMAAKKEKAKENGSSENNEESEIMARSESIERISMKKIEKRNR